MSMVGKKVRVESKGPGASPWTGEVEEEFAGGKILRVRVTDAERSWYRPGQRVDVGVTTCTEVG